MLNQKNLQRLDKLKHDIALLGLRFPVATIAKRTGFGSGNISNALNGKIPCSNTFLNRFYAAFGQELDKARANKQANEGSEAYPLDAPQSQKLKAIASTLVELAGIINQMV